MKRLLSALLIVVLLLILLSVSVAANSPPPISYYHFSISNVPYGTAYVDLLVWLPETNSHYTALVKENLPEGFTEESEIITYCEDDYRSYTFHFTNARSKIQLSEWGTVQFFADSTVSYSGTLANHKEYVERQGTIRLAMLDEKGNILKVSKKLSLEPDGMFSERTNRFQYDASADTMEVMTYPSGGVLLIMILYPIIALIGMVFTVLVEWGISKLFLHIRLYGKLIVITNIFTQIGMWILYGLSMLILPLGNGNIVFAEIAVYITEIWIYRKKMLAVPQKQCLIYTIIANTASLILGPLLVQSLLS